MPILHRTNRQMRKVAVLSTTNKLRRTLKAITTPRAMIKKRAKISRRRIRNIKKPRLAPAQNILLKISQIKQAVAVKKSSPQITVIRRQQLKMLHELFSEINNTSKAFEGNKKQSAKQRAISCWLTVPIAKDDIVKEQVPAQPTATCSKALPVKIQTKRVPLTAVAKIHPKKNVSNKTVKWIPPEKWAKMSFAERAQFKANKNKEFIKHKTNNA